MNSKRPGSAVATAARKLAIDGDGKILIVEVEPSHRRRGIATRLLAELEGAGYRVTHDWNNMRDDGEAWARSFDESPPR